MACPAGPPLESDEKHGPRSNQTLRSQKDYTSQSPKALSELERLFEMNDIEWPSEDDRIAMISKKVSNSLKGTLKSYGCVIFFSTLTKVKPIVNTFYIQI